MIGGGETMIEIRNLIIWILKYIFETMIETMSCAIISNWQWKSDVDVGMYCTILALQIKNKKEKWKVICWIHNIIKLHNMTMTIVLL